MVARGWSQPEGLCGAGSFNLADWLLDDVLRKEPHVDARSAAALAAGRLRASGSREELERLLASADEHASVRESAALALGLMQSLPSLPALQAVAADGKTETPLRVHAVIGLGLVRDSGAVAFLGEMLADAQPLEVRVAATLALGGIGGQAAADALVGIIRDGAGPAPLRAAAISGLGKLGVAKAGKWDVVELLRRAVLTDRDEHVRRGAALVLWRCTSSSVITTLERVARNDRDPVTCGFATLSLAEAACREDATPADRTQVRMQLAAALAPGADTSAHARGYAAVALGLLGRFDRAGAETLRRGLRDEPDWRTRAACAVGLGLMADTASVPELLKLVSAPTSAELRGYACVALGRLGTLDSELRRLLLDVAGSDKFPDVRAAAAMALARAGAGPDAVDALRPGLDDPNPDFRMSATMCLAHLRDPRAMGDLVHRYQNEPNPDVRTILLVAIGLLGEVGFPSLKALAADFNYLVLDPELPTIERILRLF